MNEKFVGQPFHRREDPPLLTGAANFTDDFVVDGMVHAAVLRSQYGHADIKDIDTSGADSLAGVVTVYTAEDLAASASPGVVDLPNPMPNGVAAPPRLLADGTVRYIGEPVALVVAEDRYTAHDGLDRIAVDYDRKDAVVDARDAVDRDGPTVHAEAPDNVAYSLTFGESDAVRTAFETADAAIEYDHHNQRLIGNPMEPRAVLAQPDAGRLKVTMTTQVPHGERAPMARAIGISPDEIDVVAPAVGGGFGIKGSQYADDSLIAWAAHELQQPVKWVATRSEAHAADYQSRDFYLDASLAVDTDGTIRALRVDATSNIGAYYVFPYSLFGNLRPLLSGQYAIPAIAGEARGVFTNTTPTAPYRGAGRPEAIYLIERLVQQAAAALDIDPVEFRRRNQIPADAFPYETAVGTVYDSGDYGTAMAKAVEAVDYEALRAKQAELRDSGRYLGIGLACFVENTGSSTGVGETSRVSVGSDGTVTAYLGTHDHGQGHGTSFAQLLADELELEYAEIEIKEGDTRDLPDGTGTFGSRSAALGGAAMVEAAQKVKEQARGVAAEHLEVSPDDLVYADGAFSVKGAPSRHVTLTTLASEGALEATEQYEPPNEGFTFGTHVAIVEVDPASGEVTIDRYVAVDDCGVVINPLIVEGQIHGGVTQGIAQALSEVAVYDDSGSLLTGTLQDYAIPKATQLPEYETHATVTPSPHNPLGVKGTGESGTIAATPAIANAVVDALAPFGVDDVPLPMTAERIWRAMQTPSE